MKSAQGRCMWFDRPPANLRGKPGCLLLHGFTGAPDDWWTCADCPSAHAIELPGHGSSTGPEGPFADEVAGILAGLPDGIGRVVGYSLGGRVALGLIALAPERFAEATIISAHPGLADAQLRAERRAADRRWAQRLRSEGIASFVSAWEQLPLFATQASLPEAVRVAQRRRRLAQRAEGLACSLERMGLGEMPPTWSAITGYPGRLRWVVGERDDRFRQIARQVQAIRPDIDLRVLDGVGHNPLIELL